MGRYLDGYEEGAVGSGTHRHACTTAHLAGGSDAHGSCFRCAPAPRRGLSAIPIAGRAWRSGLLRPTAGQVSRVVSLNQFNSPTIPLGYFRSAVVAISRRTEFTDSCDNSSSNVSNFGNRRRDQGKAAHVHRKHYLDGEQGAGDDRLRRLCPGLRHRLSRKADAPGVSGSPLPGQRGASQSGGPAGRGALRLSHAVVPAPLRGQRRGGHGICGRSRRPDADTRRRIR